jgi:hypothetical protein
VGGIINGSDVSDIIKYPLRSKANSEGDIYVGKERVLDITQVPIITEYSQSTHRISHPKNLKKGKVQ